MKVRIVSFIIAFLAVILLIQADRQTKPTAQKVVPHKAKQLAPKRDSITGAELYKLIRSGKTYLVIVPIHQDHPTFHRSAIPMENKRKPGLPPALPQPPDNSNKHDDYWGDRQREIQ